MCQNRVRSRSQRNLPTKLTSFSDIEHMIKEIIGFVWDLISGQ